MQAFLTDYVDRRKKKIIVEDTENKRVVNLIFILVTMWRSLVTYANITILVNMRRADSANTEKWRICFERGSGMRQNATFPIFEITQVRHSRPTRGRFLPCFGCFERTLTVSVDSKRAHRRKRPDQATHIREMRGDFC